MTDTDIATNTSDTSWVLRAGDRGHDRYLSTGESASYIAGHPESILTRHSSFNFHEYQSGRAGFGRIRVFGEELFEGIGCGYNIHPHHNFVICAFVLGGKLTHVNSLLGGVDELTAGDYYAFSTGSGGKHAELSISGEDLHVIYVWMLPSQLLLPPTYQRDHFDRDTAPNEILELFGPGSGAKAIAADVRISRLFSDRAGEHTYTPLQADNGVYCFVVDGELGWSGGTLAAGDSVGFAHRGSETLTTSGVDTDVLIVETVL